MKALIDMDVLTHSCGFAVQKTVYDVLTYDDGGNVIASSCYDDKQMAASVADDFSTYGSECVVSTRSIVEPVANALYLFKEAVEKILRNTGATSYKGFLTGTGNFREKIATIRPYKGNRDPLHKPVHYQALRDYAVKHWNAEIVDGEEADDRIAQWHKQDGTTCVCSLDKDFLQLSGYNYNPKKEVLYWVTEEEARKNFWQQVLTGDSTDNIVGCVGVGPKKAAKILEGCITDHDYYGKVLEQYEQSIKPMLGNSTNLTAEAALRENATLLWLKRTPTDEWRPPQK